MAKRSRKKPNIPESAMDHARQSADDTSSATTDTPAAPAQATVAKPRRRRRDLQSATLEKRKKSNTPLDAAFVADMLANPSKVVTEEDLKADYGFVIKDLRNMGILAAVLFVFLIGASLVLL